MVRLAMLLLMLVAIACFKYETAHVADNSTESAVTTSKAERITMNDSILASYLIKIRVKFPHVVLAQAQLETGNYTSRIFVENNNLFGMKLATVRPTTAVGERYTYACYENWQQSVIDYVMYQLSYYSNEKSDIAYINRISKTYSEDVVYKNKITQMSAKNKEFIKSLKNNARDRKN